MNTANLNQSIRLKAKKVKAKKVKPNPPCNIWPDCACILRGKRNTDCWDKTQIYYYGY